MEIWRMNSSAIKPIEVEDLCSNKWGYAFFGV